MMRNWGPKNKANMILIQVVNLYFLESASIIMVTQGYQKLEANKLM